MAITAQGITASVGTLISQGSVAGTIKTALQNEWTLAITTQNIVRNAGVTISQNEWTLTITAQPITESIGVIVTQAGGAIGTLKIALTGAGMTSAVISTAAGISFVDDIDVVIGDTTVASSTLTTVANSHSAIGILKTALVGDTTSIEIFTESGIIFVTTADIMIQLLDSNQQVVTLGSTTVTHTAITGATNSNTATSIEIQTNSGAAFVTNVNIDIAGGTTIVHANINTATNTGTTTSVVIQTEPMVTFVTSSDLLIGSTTVSSATVNAATKSKSATTVVHANVNTATQNGATTTVTLTSETNQIFDTTSDLIVGTTTVALTDVTAASQVTSTDVTGPYNSVYSLQIGQNISTVTIVDDGDAGTLSFLHSTYSVSEDLLLVTATLTRTNGASQAIEVDVVPSDLTAIKTNEWQLKIASQDIAAEEGVDVTQGIVSGTLKTVLTGSTLNVFINCADGVTFTTATDVVISAVGGDITVANANIGAAINTPSDFSPTTKKIEFAADQTLVTTTWSIVNDDIFEYPDEKFTLTLDNIRYTEAPSIADIASLHIGNTLSYLQWTMTINSAGITAAQGVTVTQSNQWTLIVAAQAITQNAGVVVTQGSSTGTLKTALQNQWTLDIASQAITQNQGVAVTQGSSVGTLNIALQNEWILDIIWQGITESVGVAVTQGSSTGTLKTMFQNEWTLNIVLQTITENVGVAVSQEAAEWTMAITAQQITENAGVTVTQGSVTGTLKTHLQNEWTLTVASQAITENGGVKVTQGTGLTYVVGTLKTPLNGATTSVIVQTAVGVAFVDNLDLNIGDTTITANDINAVSNSGTTSSFVILAAPSVTFITTSNIVIGSTTVLAANVNTATETLSGVTVSGILKTELTGATTNVVIETASDVQFTDTADLTIGGTTVVLANINAARNSNTASTIVIQTVAGVTFVNSADVVLGSTEWTLSITQDSITLQNSGVAISQGSSTGTLKTALSNEWNIVINAQTITESSRVKVSQTVSGSTVTGFLKIALSGTTTNVIITTVPGVTFLTTGHLIIGSTTVLAANVNTATSITNVVINTASSVTFSNSADIVIGTVTVGSANVIAATKTKLDGTTLLHGNIRTSTHVGTTSVSIQAASDVIFSNSADVVIGADATAITILAANVKTATHTGATTNVVILTAAGVNFVNNADVAIGTTTVLHANINTATSGVNSGTLTTTLQNEWILDITSQSITKSAGVTVTQGSITGTLKAALSGSVRSLVVQVDSGVTFVTTSDVDIDGVTVLATNLNTATNSGAITSVVISSVLGQVLDATSNLVIGSTTVLAADVTAASVTTVAALDTPTTTLTIRDDGDLGTVDFATTSFTVNERDECAVHSPDRDACYTTATFTVTRTGRASSSRNMAVFWRTRSSTDQYKTWTMTINSVVLNAHSVGVTVTQTEWTLTITLQDIIQAAGVAISQSTNNGILKTALTGATTSIVIQCAAGVTFDTAKNVVFAGTSPGSVFATTINAATSNIATGTLTTELDGSSASTSLTIRSAVGQVFDSTRNLVIDTQPILATNVLTASFTTSNSDASTIKPAGIYTASNLDLLHEDRGQINFIGQDEAGYTSTWTFTTSTAITPMVAIGATVTQGGSTGTLQVALTGGAVTTIVISAASGVSFVTNANLDLSGGDVVQHADISAAVQSDNAVEFTVNVYNDDLFEYPDEMFGVELFDIAYDLTSVSASTTTWTMTINSATLTQASGVAVTQNEFILSITSESITQSAGSAVTQTELGVTVTGTLKTALSGLTTSIVVQVAQGVIFVDTADVNIGGTVTVASANINAATSNSATGTLTTALTGVATTTITITANNNQLFDASRNLVIGSVTVLASNVVNAGLIHYESDGSTPAYFLHIGTNPISDVTIVDDGDAGIIQMASSTASINEPSGASAGGYVAVDTLTSITITATRNLGTNRIARKTQNDAKYNPSSGLAFSAGGNYYGSLSVLYTTDNTDAVGKTDMTWTMAVINAITLTKAKGVAVTQVQTEWILTITAQAITENAGVKVIQGAVEGTLKVLLSGITTKIIITTLPGVLFVTDTNNLVINPTEWTLTIAAQDITQSVGAAVTQGSVTGTLKTALTGTGMTSVVITTASSATFVSGVQVVIGSGGTVTTIILSNVNSATKTITATTVAHANINAATSNSATGTLATALTGTAAESITVTAANGQIFDVSRDLLIDGSTVLASNVGAATTTPIQPFTIISSLNIVQEQGTIDYQGAVSNTILFPAEGHDSNPVTQCASSLCQQITVAVFSDRQYETPDETFSVRLHDLTYSGSPRSEVVLNTWTLGISPEPITETANVAVTQGSSVGTLKTALTGANMQKIVIEAAPGISFVTTVDIVIGATTVQAMSIETANPNDRTTVTIVDDGDMGTISWCEYTCATDGSADCTTADTSATALTTARTTPKCDAFSTTAPWPASTATGRSLKLCGDSGNLQCNKLPTGVNYYYQVQEGAEFTVAYKRYSESGMDEQLHFALTIKYEATSSQQAVIDLGFEATQKDSTGICFGASGAQTPSSGDDFPTGVASTVPWSPTSTTGSTSVIIDECTVDGNSNQRTYMAANPFSNPSDGTEASMSPTSVNRNNWWYVFYKFTAVDDNNILSDQVFSLELALSATSEVPNPIATPYTSTTTLHGNGYLRWTVTINSDTTAEQACNCIDCGASVANAALTSGSCGVATDTCSASVGGTGCYTDCSTSCDCVTNTCDVSVTQAANVAVTQSTSSNNGVGTLTTALTGDSTTTVVITAAVGQVFDFTNDLVVGTITIKAADITAAESVTYSAGVGFVNSKVAIYIVDNDGGKAAICASRSCIVCTGREGDICTTVIDTTSDYLSNLPTVIEGEGFEEFFVVLKVKPDKPVRITMTPTSEVYRLKSENDIDFAAPGAPLTLTFQNSNWELPQAVVVKATEDETNRGGTYAGAITFSSESDQAAFDRVLMFYSLGNRAQSTDGFVLTGDLKDDDIGEVIQFALDTDEGSLTISDLGAIPTFTQNVLNDIARALGIDASRLTVRSITEGSVIFSISIAPGAGGIAELGALVENFYTMLSDKTSRLYASPTFIKYVSSSRSTDDSQDIGGPLEKKGMPVISVRAVAGRGNSQGRHYMREGRRPTLKSDDLNYELWYVLESSPRIDCDNRKICYICQASEIDTFGNVICQEPYSSMEDTTVTVSVQVDGTNIRIVSPIQTPSTTSIPSHSLQTLNTVELIFDASNWMIPQRIVIKAVEDKSAIPRPAGTLTMSAISQDSRYDTSVSGTSTVTSSSLFEMNEVASRFIHVLDNDVPGISTISSIGSTTTVKEGSLTAVHVDVVLESQPSHDVVLDVSDMFAPESLLLSPGSKTWTMTTSSTGITEEQNVIVSQNEWVLTITSQNINTDAGSIVTQGVGDTLVTGILKTALNGASTAIVVSTATDVTFTTLLNVAIESTTVILSTNVNSALLMKSATGTLTNALQNEWTFGVPMSVTNGYVTENAGVVVSQNEWTLTITSQSITASIGAVITQGSKTGTLKTALTGTTTSIVIIAAGNDVYDTVTDVVIGSGGTTTTVVHATVTTATNSILPRVGTLKTALQNVWTLTITDQAITANVGAAVAQTVNNVNVAGTLAIALTGATTSVVINTASNIVFVSTADMTIVSTTIAQTSITSASANTKTPIFLTASSVIFEPSTNVVIGSTALFVSGATNNGATTTVTITSVPGQVFDTTSNVLIGSTTVLASDITNVVSTITSKMTFTPSNWNVPKVISIRSIDNNVADLNSQSTVSSLHNYLNIWSESTDPLYHRDAATYFSDNGNNGNNGNNDNADGNKEGNVLTGGAVSISIKEDDVIGLSSACGDTMLSSCYLLENQGLTSTPLQYGVTLKSEPRDQVNIFLISNDVAVLNEKRSNNVATSNYLSSSSIMFDSSNWHIPQYLELSFEQNYYRDSDLSYSTLVHGVVSHDLNYNGALMNDQLKDMVVQRGNVDHNGKFFFEKNYFFSHLFLLFCTFLCHHKIKSLFRKFLPHYFSKYILLLPLIWPRQRARLKMKLCQSVWPLFIFCII